MPTVSTAGAWTMHVTALPQPLNEYTSLLHGGHGGHGLSTWAWRV
jgi:hypothetical protein